MLAAVEKRGPLTIDDIGAELNQVRGAIEKALKLLEVDGAVTHDKLGYVPTMTAWQPDTARFEQVTRLRRDEVEQMRRYVEHKGCLMEFLARALDDPNAARCGKCMNCTKHTERRVVPASLLVSGAPSVRAASQRNKGRLYQTRSRPFRGSNHAPNRTVAERVSLSHNNAGHTNVIMAKRIRWMG